MINSIVNTGVQRSEPTAGATGAGKPPAPTVQSAPAPSQDKAVDSGELKTAVSKLNDFVQNVQRNLSFSVDKETGETVVKVYDAQTKEVIRQIPAEETLKLAAAIDQQVSHLLLKEKA